MDAIVYALCSLTSATCAILLLRGYRTSSMRLLLWSGLCFSVLTLANIVVYIDMVVYPDGDLQTLRNCLSMLGLGILIVGMIEETV